MFTSRQITLFLAFLSASLLALLLIVLSELTANIAWYVSAVFIANFFICYSAIHFSVKRSNAKLRLSIINALQLDASPNQSLQKLLSEQANKTIVAGKNIDDKASKLAINSAEVSFFLEKLSSAIELSSEDVDRLASAA